MPLKSPQTTGRERVPKRGAGGEVKQEVCSVRNEQTVPNLDALTFQGLNLLKQGGKVDHHAVANNTCGLLAQNAGGHQMQSILGTLFIIDCVTSICSTLSAMKEGLLQGIQHSRTQVE